VATFRCVSRIPRYLFAVRESPQYCHSTPEGERLFSDRSEDRHESRSRLQLYPHRERGLSRRGAEIFIWAARKKKKIGRQKTVYLIREISLTDKRGDRVQGRLLVGVTKKTEKRRPESLAIGGHQITRSLLLQAWGLEWIWDVI